MITCFVDKEIRDYYLQPNYNRLKVNHCTAITCLTMAEGMGFEPMTPISRSNRLAGGRTRPLCDPSNIKS